MSGLIIFVSEELEESRLMYTNVFDFNYLMLDYKLIPNVLKD